jgi:hypothetical protein
VYPFLLNLLFIFVLSFVISFHVYIIIFLPLTVPQQLYNLHISG